MCGWVCGWVGDKTGATLQAVVSQEVACTSCRQRRCPFRSPFPHAEFEAFAFQDADDYSLEEFEGIAATFEEQWFGPDAGKVRRAAGGRVWVCRVGRPHVRTRESVAWPLLLVAASGRGLVCTVHGSARALADCVVWRCCAAPVCEGPLPSWECPGTAGLLPVCLCRPMPPRTILP